MSSAIELPGGLLDDAPERQSTPLPVEAVRSRTAVPMVRLARPPQDEEAAVAQRIFESLSLAPWHEHEPSRHSERHGCDDRVRSELRLGVGVQPHAVRPVAIAIHQDVIERGAATTIHSIEDSSQDPRERPLRERLPRVSIADVPGPGDEPRLQEPAPEQHDLALLPG